ncbi:MAG: hypothetical protein FWD42_10690, partial [Solirubrobacterales bacterium]|nr:hypothetical protein [Solirubrobacterales bacterium]
DEFAALLGELVQAVERELAELDAAIAEDRTALRGLRAGVRSLDAHEYARRLARARRVELVEREASLNERIVARTRLAEERASHLDTLSRGLAPEPPQAHIAKPHGPRSVEQRRRASFLRLWAAVSTPLLLASPIIVLLASPLAWIPTIGVLAVMFLGVEAFARHSFLSFLASVLMLAGVAAVVVAIVFLLSNYWQIAVSAILGAAALALLIGNLTDFRHRWQEGAAIGEEKDR